MKHLESRYSAQDMGMVMLNLFNNAFMPLEKSKRQKAKGKRPEILHLQPYANNMSHWFRFKQKKAGDKDEIRVSDNGPAFHKI